VFVPWGDVLTGGTHTATRRLIQLRLCCLAEGYELLGPPLQDGYMETPLVEVLEEGIARLQDKATWKLWEFTADMETAQFTDADSFRQYVQVGAASAG
jgi:hypothetical protein